MGNSSNFTAHESFSFGPFLLSASGRVLFEGERPVRLGSRAFALLVALVERAGEVVSRAELLASAWSDAVVDDANLSVQISALRRALGDGQAGRRYILNVSGHGYSFVAAVGRCADLHLESRHSAHPVSHNLPAHLVRLFGREHIIADLVERLEHRRLVTVVGAGGVGKSAVALRVAEQALTAQVEGVWHVDLAPIEDAALVPAALARVLSIRVQGADTVTALVAALAQRRMLLVFDNCEHVIDAVATLAIALLRGTRNLRILATSREPLRIKGEQVLRMPPLTAPEREKSVDAATALTYPAVQLFVERAADAAAGFALVDANATRVAEICHRLDGLPLAIELAAARLDLLGVNALAAHLEEALQTRSMERTTGPLARHGTSQAAIERSFRLLDDTEKVLFRRLAVFVGGFTLEAARVVISDGELTVDAVEIGLDSLLSKSLVVPDMGGREPRFRLLEATRSYALSKLREHLETDALCERHARWIADTLAAARSGGASSNHLVELLAPEIENLRTALGWSLGHSGDPALGRRLCAASRSLWVSLSLDSDCQARTKRARDTIPPDVQATESSTAIHSAASSSKNLTEVETTLPVSAQ